MDFVATLAIQGGLYLLSKAMAPNVNQSFPEREQVSDLNLPRAKEGMPIPLFWGRVRIKAPNMVWFGDADSDPVRETSGGPVIGYRYHATMQFILGIPGAKGAGSSGHIGQLHSFMIGERVVSLSGTLSPETASPFDEPTFFGGDTFGGGVRGTLAFYGGTDDQDYITDGSDGGFVTLFEAEAATYSPPSIDFVPLLPRYRGQAMVTLVNFLMGESLSAIDAFSFDVSSRVPSIALGTQLFPIGLGDANPVAVLVDILTSKWGKLGHDISNIDTVNFLAVGQTLRDEQHGFSYVLYEPRNARELIQEILTQIDAFLYVEPLTGLLTLKLIREDYVVGDLITIDPSNVDEQSEPAYAVSLRSEVYNKVLVTYTDRRKGYAERTAPAMNQANIAINGGKVRALERYFPGVHDPVLADAIAHRLLRAHGQPLAKLRVTVNRDGFALRPGICFKFTWPDYEGVVDQVFRVVAIDTGSLEDGRIVIDAVEDKFAGGAVPFAQPEWEVVPLLSAAVIEERVVTEAPRFLQLRAVLAGAINDEDIQHGFYLAKAEGQDVTYRAEILVNDATTYDIDTGSLSFPPTFTVETTYARANEPYDSATGLRIEGLVNLAAPTTSSTLSITHNGRNLILVGSELMAYETFTAMGGGVYTLQNVWRGLLDTPAVEHLAGERGYFVSGAQVGNTGIEVLDEIVARLIPRATLLQLDPSMAETDAFTVRGRTLLPYPPSDFTLAGSKAPAALAEDGVDADWKNRDYLHDRIVIGTAPSQTTDDTTYDMVGRKGTDAYQVITDADNINAALFDHVPLGQIGHGVIDVAVRAKRPDPDGGADLTAWADPMLQITAHRWRNMLRNPRFSETPDLSHWEFVNDEIIATNAAVALGGAGSYLTTAGVRPLVVAQTVNVAGYFPSRLRALLDLYARNWAADIDDTLTVTLRQLNAAGATLVDTVYGPTAQSSTLWAHLTLDVANCHADTVSLRVILTGTRVGGTNVNVAITECILRLGQLSDQLLANPNFSAGAGTSWTAVTGTWQYLATNKYVDGFYTRPNDGASAELAQTVSIPAGFNYGTVVLECARMNDDVGTDDTGAVVVEALNVSNVVVATATTGTEAMTTINIWERRRVTLELPDTATQVRVRAVATRVAGTPLNSCFDDFDVRIHKHLEPGYEKVLDLSEPTVQYLPATLAEWFRRFPAVATPDYGFWGGATLTELTGNGPDMESDNVTIGKLVGCWDGTIMATPAMNFPVGSAALTTGNVHYANFKSNQAFTVIATIKTTKVSSVICERLDTTGWSMDINGTGNVRIRMVGSTTVTEVSPQVLTDGGVHQVAMIYDSVAQTMRLVVDGVTGLGYVSSTAALGEIQMTGLVNFVIGTGFEGQLARLTIHRTALAVADVQAMWTHAGDPTGGDLTYIRAGTLAVTVGSDADGVLVGRFGADQIAVGHSTSLDGTGFGLVQVPDIANLCPTNDMTAGATWVNLGATIAYPAIDGPEGDRKVTRITGDNTDWLALNFTHGTSSTAASAVYFARADVAHDMRCVVYSDANGIRETFVVPLTTTWQRFDKVTALWVGGDTGDGEIRFVPSVDGTARTIDIAGPFFVGRTSVVPEGIPMPATTAAHASAEYVATLPIQFNHEGEVVVTAIARQSGAASMSLVQVDNNNDFNDTRGLRLSASAEPVLEHRNSASATTSSTGAASSWNDAFTVRGRWCRAGLLDAAASFAGVVNGSTLAADSDYGRVATWTATDVPMEVVRIGVDEPSLSSFNGLIQTVTLYARESRLPAV